MPEITDEYAESVSDRYIELYEHITGEKFDKAAEAVSYTHLIILGAQNARHDNLMQRNALDLQRIEIGTADILEQHRGTKHGVKPVQNRLEAENSKGKLVYVGSNPFFYVDKLNNSIPRCV